MRAIPGAGAYAVAKAGLHHLARVLAVEWAARRIRCNAIAPGPVDTPMLRGRLDPAEDLDARFGGVNPLGRIGRDAEIAALAVHLLSDESGWTTGTVIPCDGGATAAF
jgi:2-keto-3-deoxy-L-fuconate dehydrogenase